MGFARWLGLAAMKPFARALPVMGDTERAALEAGTVGFEGRLFSGRPDFDAPPAAGPNVPGTGEPAFLDKKVTALCSRATERAAQASSRPELALAYLRAADKVIQVDDFAP